MKEAFINKNTEPEKTFDEEKYAEALEFVKRIRYPEDRLAILLVLKGLKPVAMLQRDVFTIPAVQRLGIPYYISGGILQIVIAKDKEDLERHKKVEDNKDGNQHDAELGKLLGYPETSVDAFAKHQTLKIDELPQSVKESGILDFVTFAFSREHWRDELEELKKQIMLAKTLDEQIDSKIDWVKLNGES
jgi:hypothetical protein